MEAECEDGRQNMNLLHEEFGEARKKSAETVEETRCDACCQIAEMEDKLYAKFENAEETRRASCQQESDIISE